MTRPAPVQQLAGDLLSLDTLTAGMTRVTAGYLIPAPRPALVECGPARSIDAVIGGLRSLGMDPGDLAYLVLSHVHLDHAGGAGDLAAAFPAATVVVSELGAPHLVDPQRLNASSRRVYGPLMDEVYGDCAPVDRDRLVAVGAQATLALGGGRRLELRHAPGHAKHHIAVMDSDTGSLFVGDSVGVRLPGMDAIRPATPPPDFDYVLAQATLARYVEMEPAGVYLAHYGPVEPPLEALAQAQDALTEWFQAAEGAYSEHPDLDHVAETLGRRFATEAPEDPDDPDALRRLELLSGIPSNAAGLYRYLSLRDEGRVQRVQG